MIYFVIWPMKMKTGSILLKNMILREEMISFQVKSV